MPANGQVRFGGGPEEKGDKPYLACGLPNANMTAAVERFLNTKHSCLRQAVGLVNKTAGAAEELRASVAETKRPSKLDLWNERRRARHEQVRTLHRQGASIQAISRELRRFWCKPDNYR